MKNPLYIVCASSLSLFCAPDSFAENTDHKSGFYVTGKVGASVLQQKNQKYLQNYSVTYPDYDYTYQDHYYGKSGGTHSNARLGGGIAVGYNFDNHFNVPVRVEIDVMARMGDSSNYLRESGSYSLYRPQGATEYYEDKVNNKVQLNTFMLNGFYDFKNKSAFTPYLMGGVGLATMDQTAIRNVTDTIYAANNVLDNSWARLKRTHTTNNVAWNAGAGVRYKIDKDFSLDFSYRYLDAGKSSFSTYNRAFSSPYYTERMHERTKARVVTQDIMLGLTYNF